MPSRLRVVRWFTAAVGLSWVVAALSRGVAKDLEVAGAVCAATLVAGHAKGPRPLVLSAALGVTRHLLFTCDFDHLSQVDVELLIGLSIMWASLTRRPSHVSYASAVTWVAGIALLAVEGNYHLVALQTLYCATCITTSGSANMIPRNIVIFLDFEAIFEMAKSCAENGALVYSAVLCIVASSIHLWTVRDDRDEKAKLKDLEILNSNIDRRRERVKEASKKESTKYTDPLEDCCCCCYSRGPCCARNFCLDNMSGCWCGCAPSPVLSEQSRETDAPSVDNHRCLRCLDACCFYSFPCNQCGKSTVEHNCASCFELGFPFFAAFIFFPVIYIVPCSVSISRIALPKYLPILDKIFFAHSFPDMSSAAVASIAVTMAIMGFSYYFVFVGILLRKSGFRWTCIYMGIEFVAFAALRLFLESGIVIAQIVHVRNLNFVGLLLPFLPAALPFIIGGVGLAFVGCGVIADKFDGWPCTRSTIWFTVPFLCTVAGTVMVFTPSGQTPYDQSAFEVCIHEDATLTCWTAKWCLLAFIPMATDFNGSGVLLFLQVSGIASALSNWSEWTESEDDVTVAGFILTFCSICVSVVGSLPALNKSVKEANFEVLKEENKQVLPLPSGL